MTINRVSSRLFVLSVVIFNLYFPYCVEERDKTGMPMTHSTLYMKNKIIMDIKKTQKCGLLLKCQQNILYKQTYPINNHKYFQVLSTSLFISNAYLIPKIILRSGHFIKFWEVGWAQNSFLTLL